MVVHPASHEVSRASWYSGFRSVSSYFAYGTFTLYGLSFPAAHSAILRESLYRSSTPGDISITRFGLIRFRSPLLTESLFDFFSCWYLDVSVPNVCPRYTMYSCNDDQMFSLAGFPHSDICGSMAICASPQLFAAYHVLHRLLVPRHSPYALSSLTSKMSICFALLCQTSCPALLIYLKELKFLINSAARHSSSLYCSHLSIFYRFLSISLVL